MAIRIRDMEADLLKMTELTELHDDLTKVVWMPRPAEETNIANCTIMLMFASENIFLDVCNTLHDESDRPKDYTSYISPSSELGLRNASAL